MINKWYEVIWSRWFCERKRRSCGASLRKWCRPSTWRNEQPHLRHTACIMPVGQTLGMPLHPITWHYIYITPYQADTSVFMNVSPLLLLMGLFLLSEPHLQLVWEKAVVTPTHLNEWIIACISSNIWRTTPKKPHHPNIQSTQVIANNDFGDF